MSFANLNLEGRIVNEPEFKTGKSGEFCTFRVVVNQQFGAQENASFYNCTGNEAMANRIRKAGLGKGRIIHINGNLTLCEYKNRDGVTCTSADVGILDWHFVGSKPKSDDAPAATPQYPDRTGVVRDEEYIGDDDELPI